MANYSKLTHFQSMTTVNIPISIKHKHEQKEPDNRFSTFDVKYI